MGGITHEQWHARVAKLEADCARKDAALQAVQDVIDNDLDAERIWPRDVFLPPQPGQHSKSVDGCSAAALRAVLPGIRDRLRAALAEAAPAAAEPDHSWFRGGVNKELLKEYVKLYPDRVPKPTAAPEPEVDLVRVCLWCGGDVPPAYIHCQHCGQQQREPAPEPQPQREPCQCCGKEHCDCDTECM